MNEKKKNPPSRKPWGGRTTAEVLYKPSVYLRYHWARVIPRNVAADVAAAVFGGTNAAIMRTLEGGLE